MYIYIYIGPSRKKPESTLHEVKTASFHTFLLHLLFINHIIKCYIVRATDNVIK
jgi:hypothetical protein